MRHRGREKRDGGMEDKYREVIRYEMGGARGKSLVEEAVRGGWHADVYNKLSVRVRPPATQRLSYCGCIA